MYPLGHAFRQAEIQMTQSLSLEVMLFAEVGQPTMVSGLRKEVGLVTILKWISPQ